MGVRHFSRLRSGPPRTFSGGSRSFITRLLSVGGVKVKSVRLPEDEIYGLRESEAFSVDGRGRRLLNREKWRTPSYYELGEVAHPPGIRRRNNDGDGWASRMSNMGATVCM
jgi:hypothetical protein